MWHWNDFEGIPHIQGQKRSPSKTVGGAKSRLESTPYLPETLRGLKQILCAPGPRDPQRETELCLSVSCGVDDPEAQKEKWTSLDHPASGFREFQSPSSSLLNQVIHHLQALSMACLGNLRKTTSPQQDGRRWSCGHAVLERL